MTTLKLISLVGNVIKVPSPRSSYSSFIVLLLAALIVLLPECAGNNCYNSVTRPSLSRVFAKKLHTLLYSTCVSHTIILHPKFVEIDHAGASKTEKIDNGKSIWGLIPHLSWGICCDTIAEYIENAKTQKAPTGTGNARARGP